MDFPLVIIWVSPLSFLGESGVVLIFIHFFDQFSVSKQNSPDGKPHSAVLGLYCLPMSHKNDARLI